MQSFNQNLVYLATVFARCLVCSAIFYPSQTKASPPKTLKPGVQLPSVHPEEIPGSVVLKRFEIIGNQVISESEIDRLLQPYLFRPISFIELLEVQQAITQLFVKKGYFTSGAYIPPQKITDRTVKIEIIEGSIEDIKIYGLKHLRPEYIRERIEVATKPPVNRSKLLNALQILQLDPLIANISAELSQGINPGESLLEIEVKEANTFKTELSFNNYQAVTVGSQGRRLFIGDNNVLGFGDRFGVSYLNSPGSNSLENLSYTIPLGANNNELQIAYSYSDSSIISEPFKDLDLSSRGSSLNASYRQKILHTPRKELTLGVAFNYQNTQLFLMDVGFPTLARGTDETGVTKIAALQFIQEYSDRGEGHVLALSSQFNLGINVFDATINPPGIPDSHFLIWRGQGQYIKQLSEGTNILLRGQLQLADRPLVSLEQFRSGGAASVRGYRRDRTLADNGLFLSTELSHTIWQTNEGKNSLTLNPFGDFSQVWNTDDLAPEVETLASLGLGLQLLLGDALAARVDWGIPLIQDTDFEEDSLQDQGIYFSLELKPF
ncbi:MAG: ShlB/FhaC/HecB family hemolysin secretion/activation protein [Waterburya sp.]